MIARKEFTAISLQTLKKTERSIMNEHCRDTGNIGHTNHRTMTKKTINTTQKTKKMSNTDPTKNQGMNTDAREGLAVPAF